MAVILLSDCGPEEGAEKQTEQHIDITLITHAVNLSNSASKPHHVKSRHKRTKDT